MKSKVLILVVTLVFMCMSVGSVYAIEVRKAENSCGDEFKKYCGDVSRDNLEEALKCIKKHKKDLSPECRAYLDQIDGMIKAMIKETKKGPK